MNDVQEVRAQRQPAMLEEQIVRGDEWGKE